MPEKIDAHQHFWRYDPGLYPWIDGALKPLARDFLPVDLEPELAARGVAGTVAVQARQDIDETLWLLELAAAHPFIRGVVGWVDLRAADVAAELQRVASDRLVGVRHVLQDESPEFLLDPAFRRGIAQLAGAGLTYDLLIFPQHLPNAHTLCAENPDLRIVLDHCAKPLIEKGELEPWARDVRALARLDHVACKVSGLVTEADWSGWQPADFRPYFDVIFEAFGVERLMFGSDWPVCTVAGDYGAVHDLVAEYVAGHSAAAPDALFGGNAARFYGLHDG